MATAVLSLLLLLVVGAHADDSGDNEKKDTNGECLFAHYDAGIDMSKVNPQCNGKIESLTR